MLQFSSTQIIPVWINMRTYTFWNHIRKINWMNEWMKSFRTYKNCLLAFQSYSMWGEKGVSEKFHFSPVICWFILAENNTIETLYFEINKHQIKQRFVHLHRHTKSSNISALPNPRVISTFFIVLISRNNTHNSNRATQSNRFKKKNSNSYK